MVLNIEVLVVLYSGYFNAIFHTDCSTSAHCKIQVRELHIKYKNVKYICINIR